MIACAICPTTADDPTGWSTWELEEPIEWRSAFATDGAMPPTPAGRYQLCPACTSWMPGHRSAPLPEALRSGIDTMLGAQQLHPATRRRLLAELVGNVRHLAGRLTPAITEKEEDR